MAYDIGRLRLQNLASGYDQLTPGAMGGSNYMDEGSNPTSPYTPGLEQVAAQQDRDAILGPDGQPLRQDPQSVIQTPTVTQVGAPRVDPNARTFKQTLDEMNAGYTPDYTSRDRLNALLDAPPERGEPGWGRTLVAAGMSVKAQDPIATAEKVQYAPYYRDVEDWKTKATPFTQAAELENRQNINERTIVSNAATSYAAAEKNRIQEQKNLDAAETARIRARAYEYSQRLGKGYEWDLSGPTAKKMNKTTGDIVDTGIPTGKLDEQTRIDMLNEGKIAAAQASGQSAVERARASGAQIVTGPDGNTYVINPNAVPPTSSQVEGMPSGAVTRPGTPRTGGTGAGGGSTNRLEARRQINDRLQETYETDPTNRDYVKKTGEGKFQFAERPVVGKTVGSTFGFGGRKITEQDVEAYDDYRSSVDPSYKPPTKGLGPSASNTPATSTVPNTNTGTRTSDPGTIEATSPSGVKQKITNDPEVIAHWKSKGYTVGGSTSGVGPSTPPEKWAPRGDYTAKPKDAPPATGNNKPWFVDKAKDIYSEASKKPTGPREASGLPEKQVTTPEGIISVPHGKVAIRDVATGQIVQIPEANLAKAIATGKYTKVK